ncbi:MAG TPA: bifunctional UDP-N-acetylglucosamine diphosphorylase/glucosamine-1-phosphate N-acetyltransferase GlmU [Myxococcota bacterium]|nr:bifunctional UDP-N-acetylglucosamine diphosphorylase/glucosamine-1-phosphate N-acetyltransferase GlmU [Myxococcota bacterium]
MPRGELALVLMAAGKGTRMRSRLPKVLHPVCGRPILMHALELGRELGATRRIAIVGSGEEQVRAALAEAGYGDVELVRQAEQRGTAHAALQAKTLLSSHDGPVLVMNGDHPLYRARTFVAMREAWERSRADLEILVTELPNPTGYGRVLRDAGGKIARIVEELDLADTMKGIGEVNLGAYLAHGRLLFELLERVRDDNEKGEFYITDLVEIARQLGKSVDAARADDWQESLGINTKAELAQAEALLRQRLCDKLMRDGVTLVDPERSYVEVDVEIGEDTVVAPGAVIRRGTRIGAGCRIDPGVVIEGCTLGDDVWVKPGCTLEGSKVANGCVLGPNAHLRPGADLREDVRLGNYVEVKNSVLGKGTKADHLTYIGDADVGEGVTFGCGSIVVNYDGEKKRRTTIGDHAFIGCNSNLLAPVVIEAEAYVGAGSTISKTVPSGALGIARAEQRNIEGWRKRRFKGGGHHDQ